MWFSNIITFHQTYREPLKSKLTFIMFEAEFDHGLCIVAPLILACHI